MAGVKTMYESIERNDPCFPGATDAPLRQPWGASVGLQQGSALASVVSVYRNDLWQRVPKLLLVQVRICCMFKLR